MNTVVYDIISTYGEITNNIVPQITITETSINNNYLDNFDTFGAKFLLAIFYLSIQNSINYFTYPFSSSDNNNIFYVIFGINTNNIVYQTDILIYQYCNALFNLFYSKYQSFIIPNN